MKYLVMECHLSYAVVLDEEGRFLRVANRHYKVGQMVTNIIEMQIPQEWTEADRKKRKNWIYSLAAVAACLILVAVSMLRMGQTIYASVYMAINPEVRIDVNRNDVVIGLEGINGDGRDLIEDYLYQKKDLNVVMSELVDRAIDMGYLHEGGQISLTLDSGDGDWISAHGSSLEASLNEHLTEKMNVTIEITNRSSSGQQIIIPIEPDSQDIPDREETSETASEYETDEVLDTGDDTDNPDTGDEQNNSVRPEPPEDESQTSEEPDRDPWLPGNDGDEEGASEGSRDENDGFNSDVTGDDGGENNGRDDDGTDDDNRDDDDADNDDGDDDNGDDGDRNDGADDDRNDDDADDNGRDDDGMGDDNGNDDGDDRNDDNRGDDADDDDDRNDDNGDGNGDTDDDDDADDDDDRDDDDDMDDDNGRDDDTDDDDDRDDDTDDD